MARPGRDRGCAPRVARIGALVSTALCAIVIMPAFGCVSASAASGPMWRIVSVSQPTNLPPKGEGELVLRATNVGDASSDGSTITIADQLPEGLTATAISGLDVFTFGFSVLSCSTPPTLDCTYSGTVPTGDTLEVTIPVSVDAGAADSVVNHATISGGGAQAPASVGNRVTVSSTPAAFGVAPGSVFVAASTRQAGAHPDVTAAFAITTTGTERSAGNLRDVRVDLPPGLVGNTVGVPRCPSALASNWECPADTIVGTANVIVANLGGITAHFGGLPVYNIAPSPGEPAAFLFNVSTAKVRLDTSLLSNGNYAVRVTAGNISEALPVLGSAVTIWGVPADHQGPGPIETNAIFGGPNPEATRVPLLSNPTDCSTPLVGSVRVDEWGAPGVFSPASQGEASMGSVNGCDSLAFGASMSMLPDTLEAGAPAGYSLHLHVPQINDPNALAQSDVKKVVTTLPMGTVISPSAAWGLQACSDEQFFGPVSQRGSQEPAVPGACPREAQVGTVEIRTPALELPLQGQVYLATPDCRPCSPEDAQDGRMVRLFVQVVGEGETGIVVKLEGHGQVNQQTGQITATFDNNPPVPFSDLKLTLGGGSRATLANPRACGPVTTNMGLTPWSTPFTTEVSPFYTFEINQDCLTPQFAPSFVAGSTNIQAGEYSPFTVSFGRTDRDEFLNGLQMQMPAGLLGSLTGIPLCKEPEAAQGTCPQASLIGHTQVLTGPGGTPFLVTGGQVFISGSYRGAPYGLSIVVPAVAGPYTLSGTTGHGTVVVRAAINVDPHTAALTVTSDPLPTILDGIPLQLKVVNVTVDRPAFTLNPTSCARMAIAGTLTSQESAGVRVASPFQVTNCHGLGFKPQFKVSTSGHTTRANGASLDAKVTYPTGPKLANIAKVKVDLPRQLPSRLTTLQKACPAQTFNANPAGCPDASRVGIAKAMTPILPVTLTGPAYFVSHGGEAFPNLIIVLQGYGVRVDLIGDTFINKAGITSSTFTNVPDVPVSSFELYLPQGPFSALAANGNLCTTSLQMPTLFTAQNGMIIKQTTPITTTGCKAKTSRAHKAKRARRARRARGARAAGRARAAGAPHNEHGRGKR
jgi:hypothetical protein